MTYRATLYLALATLALMVMFLGAAPCAAAGDQSAATSTLPIAEKPPADKSAGTEKPAAADKSAGTEKAPCTTCGLTADETLTGHWFGLGDKLAAHGIETRLDLTQVYQQNLHGGLATDRAAGRYAGQYNLQIDAQTESLFGLQGGRIHTQARGSFTNGLDPHAVGSLFGVDNAANGPHAIWMQEFYYEQIVMPDKVLVRVGKIDLTGGVQCCGCPVAFDGNSFANDKTTQFLNGSLVNNPTIPFPDPGLAVVVHVTPVEWWYLSAGAADGRARVRELDFETTFNDDARIFTIYETGVTPKLPSANGPLQGAYRVGFWCDPRMKARFDGTGFDNSDAGLYVSCDQQLWNENNQNDGQGLGAFFRYGNAQAATDAVKTFWSAGSQYRGLIPGRDKDVLAVGFGTGRLANDPGAGFTHNAETVLETYYNIAVTPWFQISPDVQYVAHPGGGNTPDATVFGIRFQITF